MLQKHVKKQNFYTSKLDVKLQYFHLIYLNVSKDELRLVQGYGGARKGRSRG